jgi:VIT1/CCC1 family predicted Fe2+/Mn2+ transporter
MRAKKDVNKAEKHPHIPARAILDRIILGGSDGAIEGLATTAALNGAGLAFGTITLAGLAFAVAGALSMFFSSYLSRKSEIDSLKIDIAREKGEIETEPEEEKNEMKTLLTQDGYNTKEVEVIMGRLQKNKDLWLKEMLRRELKVIPEDVRRSPFASPFSAGMAFFLLALLAVVPYAFSLARGSALLASVGLSLLALFALGSRALVPRNFRPVAGLESALIGALAGGLLYFVGILISRL